MKFIKVKATRLTNNDQTARLPRDVEFFINPSIIKTIDPTEHSITLMEDQFNVNNGSLIVGIAAYSVQVINYHDLDTLI